MSGPSEFVAAASLLGLLVVLNVFNVLHQRFDSDEPQQLHVIWGWTRGLIQYRDLFDNHMPLFHIMFAPILGVIGERASALFLMRLILLPTYFMSAWCTYQIIARGFLTDDAPQRCIETRTCVAATAMMYRFSANTRQFLESNYLPVTETLRVAGTVLRPSAKDSHRFDFKVVIAANYKIVSRDQNVSGTLDGTAYFGSRFLAAGTHTFESASTYRDLILLWAQAVDRHFMPFEHVISPNG